MPPTSVAVQRALSSVNAIVPINRFDEGEAVRVFKEVEETGFKVVVNNNVPACVLVSPKQYQEIMDIIEDQYLLALSFMREKDNSSKIYSFEELLSEDGMCLADIDSMDDVEIE